MDNNDKLTIKALGAGSEVGRSCIIVSYKNKNIMLDCGLHPGLAGQNSLPFFDEIDLTTIDLVLVTHFHNDHCSALPYLLEKTDFNGKVFMTPLTKKIYFMTNYDTLRVNESSNKNNLYSIEDLKNSMNKIQTVQFNQIVDLDGISFYPLPAGHVIGAAMFFIEIAGTTLLYSGDYSPEADRHLPAAEPPKESPDIFIVESTYGNTSHMSQKEREERFLGSVSDTLLNGGKILLPVFSMGRVQEILLILEEFFKKNQKFADIPIFYFSPEKTLELFAKNSYFLNEKIQKNFEKYKNPFFFEKIISTKFSKKIFDEIFALKSCVVIASPGLLQNGISRQIFDNFADDEKNGVVLTGYCVEGTLAAEILKKPKKFISASGQEIDLKCKIDYISFSAHSDYPGTMNFVKKIAPKYVVLVHGEINKMNAMKMKLEEDLKDEPNFENFKVHAPEICQNLEIFISKNKKSRVLGNFVKKLQSGECAEGLVVEGESENLIVAPEDVSLAQVKATKISHFLKIKFDKKFFDNFRAFLKNLCENNFLKFEEVTEAENSEFKLGDDISIKIQKDSMTINYAASPTTNMIIDLIIMEIVEMTEIEKK